MRSIIFIQIRLYSWEPKCKDSIWNTAIRFAIWFESLAVWVK